MRDESKGNKRRGALDGFLAALGGLALQSLAVYLLFFVWEFRLGRGYDQLSGLFLILNGGLLGLLWSLPLALATWSRRPAFAAGLLATVGAIALGNGLCWGFMAF